MNELPKITVLLPSLNVKPYICECLDSVVNQTLEEIEIICIDAGSTDGTLEMLQERAEKDHRITMIHSPIQSYGHQINLGLEAATGEYIGIVETDDYIDREMYQKLFEAAETAHIPDIVKAAYYNVDAIENGGKQANYLTDAVSGEVFSINAHPELLCGHPSIWSCIYKTTFLNRRNIRMMECPGAAWVDNPFLFRTLCEAESIVWLRDPLYYYRRTNPNASSHLRDCSIPLDRINDVKDYLEKNHKNDFLLEKCLVLRALNNIEEIKNNPYLTPENRKQIRHTLKRFRFNLLLRVAAGRQYRRMKNKMFLSRD